HESQSIYHEDPREESHRATPHKIDDRRGQHKCFSGAELERRADADRPVRVAVRAVERLGVVEAQYEEAQQVGPNRAAPALQRLAHVLEIVPGVALPLDLVPGVPGEPDVVDQDRLDWPQADWQDAEHEVEG